MQLVDNNCVLYPRELEFRFIDLPEPSSLNVTQNYTRSEDTTKQNAQNSSVRVENINDDKNETVKRDVSNINSTAQNDTDTGVIENDVNILSSKFIIHIIL